MIRDRLKYQQKKKFEYVKCKIKQMCKKKHSITYNIEPYILSQTKNY